MDQYVSQDEFKWVKGGDIVKTEGAGPCIIIGIHDREKKYAYLIHEEFACMSGTLIEFINTVKENSNANDLTAYIRGGSIFTGIPKDEENDLKDNRTFVIEKLEEFLSPSQIDCEWAKNDTESKMIIDAESGRVSFSF